MQTRDGAGLRYRAVPELQYRVVTSARTFRKPASRLGAYKRGPVLHQGERRVGISNPPAGDKPLATRGHVIKTKSFRQFEENLLLPRCKAIAFSINFSCHHRARAQPRIKDFLAVPSPPGDDAYTALRQGAISVSSWELPETTGRTHRLHALALLAHDSTRPQAPMRKAACGIGA